uniref:Proteolipid protein 2 n=2 Tax=Canis lupus familiaris TaxID=9615 RepID=A0A8P0SUU9_CANLF
MVEAEHLSARGCWTVFTNFLCSRKGTLLCAEMILCLVILIWFSLSTPAYSSLSVVEMILAEIFFVIYMCDLASKIQYWSWIDFFRTLIAATLYLITSIVVLVEGGNRSIIIAGVLGLIAVFLFGYDAFITYPSSIHLDSVFILLHRNLQGIKLLLKVIYQASFCHIGLVVSPVDSR